MSQLDPFSSSALARDQARSRDAFDYFATLAAHATEGTLLELRARRAGPRRETWTAWWFAAEDHARAAEHALELAAGGWTVYVGVNARARRGTGRCSESGQSFGTAHDVLETRWLVLDVDVHDGRRALATGQAAALVRSKAAAARALGLPAPALAVATGRGACLYWPLPEGTPRELARAAGQAIAAKLGGDPSVADAARILRVPGVTRQDLTLPTPVSLLIRDPSPEQVPIPALEALTASREPTKVAKSTADRFIDGTGRPCPLRPPSSHLQAGVARALRGLENHGATLRYLPASEYEVVARLAGVCIFCGGRRQNGEQGSAHTAFVTRWGGYHCFRPACIAFTERGGLRLSEWGHRVGAPYVRERTAREAGHARARAHADAWEQAVQYLADCAVELGALGMTVVTGILRWVKEGGGLPGGPARPSLTRGSRATPKRGPQNRIWTLLSMGPPPAALELLTTRSERTVRRLEQAARERIQGMIEGMVPCRLQRLTGRGGLYKGIERARGALLKATRILGAALVSLREAAFRGLVARAEPTGGTLPPTRALAALLEARPFARGAPAAGPP